MPNIIHIPKAYLKIISVCETKNERNKEIEIGTKIEREEENKRGEIEIECK